MSDKVFNSFIKKLTCIASRDRLVVRTLRCGRNNPGSNPGHGTIFAAVFRSRPEPFFSFNEDLQACFVIKTFATIICASWQSNYRASQAMCSHTKMSLPGIEPLTRDYSANQRSIG